jgi:hypothetical protein
MPAFGSAGASPSQPHSVPATNFRVAGTSPLRILEASLAAFLFFVRVGLIHV